MKKNYITPALQVVAMDSTHAVMMMTGSLQKEGKNATISFVEGDDDPVENTSFDTKGENAWAQGW